MDISTSKTRSTNLKTTDTEKAHQPIPTALRIPTPLLPPMPQILRTTNTLEYIHAVSVWFGYNIFRREYI